jgi:serine/threonine-protein kinase
MDWGVAKRNGQEPLLAGKPGELIGTPAYMSPEQARGEVADERSDVYALCLLFHEFLCLTHPLAEKNTVVDMLHAVIHDAVPNTSFVSSPHQPPVPAELGWFVSTGLAKDPAKRFQSVREMIGRLERRAEGSFPIQCPMTLTKRGLGIMRRFVDHHPLATMILLGAWVLSFLFGIGALGWHAIH